MLYVSGAQYVQVRYQLWRKVRAAYGRASLPETFAAAGWRRETTPCSTETAQQCSGRPLNSAVGTPIHRLTRHHTRRNEKNRIVSRVPSHQNRWKKRCAVVKVADLIPRAATGRREEGRHEGTRRERPLRQRWRRTAEGARSRYGW